MLQGGGQRRLANNPFLVIIALFTEILRWGRYVKQMRRYVIRVALVAAACAALLNLPALTGTGAAQSPNLLVNGGMEGRYGMQCSALGQADWVPVPCGDPIDYGTTFLWQTVQVPLGWAGWWLPPNHDESDPDFYSNYPYQCVKGIAPVNCVVWHNPEFRDTAGGPREPSRKVAGDNSQKYFTFFSLHEAGLYQVVGGIRPGARLRFSVYMQAWSTDTNDPLHSEGQPTMGLKVGIDPYGGVNPWSPSIVWSDVTEAFDQWELFTVEAVAQSDRVTVFTRSRPYFALEHNDVYVDEASLVVIGSGPVVNTTTRPKTTPTPASWLAGASVIVNNTGGLRLRLRTEPRAQTGTVTTVTVGTKLVIVTGPRKADGFVWWKVREPVSKAEGWAAQNFLRAPGTSTPKTTATPKATTGVKVTPAPGKLTTGRYAAVSGTDGQRLKLRSEPSLQAAELTRVYEGTRLLLLEGPKTVGSFVWWKVRDPQSGSEGWAAQKYLVPAVAP